jgi:hypothetical protein
MDQVCRLPRFSILHPHPVSSKREMGRRTMAVPTNVALRQANAIAVSGLRLGEAMLRWQGF